MQIFKIKKGVEIVCEWKKTRIAFKHVATLLVNGREIDEVKICYQNRTWERYTYESVLRKLLDKTGILNETQSKKWLDKAGNAEAKEVSANFKTIGAIAALGDIFGNSQKESNDWKSRMLKAGLGGRGLIIPDDWDSLNEETKQARLDAVVAQLSN